MNYFIFITTDVEHIKGYNVPAYEVIMGRLKQKKWPIYKNTRNRRSFESGDICLAYVAGRNIFSNQIIAEFSIENIHANIKLTPIDADYLLTGNPEYVINIDNIKLYESGKKIKDLLNSLSFKPKNLKKWGVVLIGGTRKITKSDYKVLTSS